MPKNMNFNKDLVNGFRHSSRSSNSRLKKEINYNESSESGTDEDSEADARHAYKSNIARHKSGQNSHSNRHKTELPTLEDSDEQHHVTIKPKKRRIRGNETVAPKRSQKHRSRILPEISSSSDFESEGEDPMPKVKKSRNNVKRGQKRKEKSKRRERNSGRKRIKKIIEEKDLLQETKEAAKEEQERLKRLKKREELSQSLESVDGSKGGAAQVSVILQKDPLVGVSPYIAQFLRPHQIEGVRFIWDNVVETTEQAKSNPGGGCILAHCMGLGKTLQTIACVHTFLKCEYLPFKCVLVVVPLNTVLNWVEEFVHWIEDGDELLLYNLSICKSNKSRVTMLRSWKKYGGVLITGYDMFRIMVTKIKYAGYKKTVKECMLDPGPDLVVCDEGHMLKNSESHISSKMKLIKTRRRIVLTGTPLQNNLTEYHCMVNFVKPGLLGSLKEFRNRFVNPIENGQHKNSTEADVNVMKKRSHVLHEMLSGFVQRKDYSALTSYLYPKYEYVVKVRLTPLQIKIYQHYLDTMTNRGADATVVLLFKTINHFIYQSLIFTNLMQSVSKPIDFLSFNVNAYNKQSSLFYDYHNLMRVWTHPKVLLLHTVQRERREMMRDFLDSEEEAEFSTEGEEAEKERKVSDEGESSSKLKNEGSKKESNDDEKPEETEILDDDEREMTDSSMEEESSEEKTEQSEISASEEDSDEIECVPTKSLRLENRNMSTKYRLRGGECDDEDEDVQEEESTDWYSELLPEDKSSLEGYQNSSKVAILFEILRLAEEHEDKVLVFSQSLLSLDLIECMLSMCNPPIENEDQVSVGKINPNPTGTGVWYKNVDYFRMDGSSLGHHRQRWINAFNDENETRARLFLISTKAGSLGVNLVGANRVVIFDASWNPSHDTQSMFRVYRFGQKKTCYIYRLIAEGTMEEKIYERQVTKQSLANRVVDEQQINRYFTSHSLAEMYSFNPTTPDTEKVETPVVPKDKILAEILDPRSRHLIVSYHEHDSLLDHQVQEELTEEERKAAWEEYEYEKNSGPPALQDKGRNTFTNVPPEPSLNFDNLSANDLLLLVSKVKKMMQDTIIKIKSHQNKPVPEIISQLRTNPHYASTSEDILFVIANEVNFRLNIRREEAQLQLTSLQMQYKILDDEYIKKVSLTNTTTLPFIPSKENLLNELASTSASQVEANNVVYSKPNNETKENMSVNVKPSSSKTEIIEISD